MKRFTSLILVVAASAAHAAPENTINPLNLLSQMQATPWSSGFANSSSPFGLGALNPLNPLNGINPLSPWNNYGGGSNPASALAALSALSSGNPFAGNTLQGNPFLRSSQPQFNVPAFSPSMPSFPTLPFATQPQQNIMQGGYYPMQQMPMQQMPMQQMPMQQMPRQPMWGQYVAPPQQQAFPFPPYGMQQQAVQQIPTQQPYFYAAPQPMPQQPLFANFPNFFIPTQTAQPAPQPMQPPVPQFQPFQQFPWLQALPLQPTALKPTPTASEPTHKPVAVEKAEPNQPPKPPLDPAAFMQMYMKPLETNK